MAASPTGFQGCEDPRGGPENAGRPLRRCVAGSGRRCVSVVSSPAVPDDREQFSMRASGTLAAISSRPFVLIVPTRYLAAPHADTVVVAIREAFWAVAGRAA